MTCSEKAAANNTTKELTEEIKHILERNQNEDFLRKLLTHAIILEKIMK